ncbi:hypothetical protein RvY_05271 [Ramazzottius varieornatus]|uniref:Uncharacterized protein n=1 Tax=Ramazzottius varieornatus TaxID=947166 RepID=A0A1D1UUI4_RAMVA|nr:hypothetical protein RvY_05271 [Ramazzottius varieornatus]
MAGRHWLRNKTKKETPASPRQHARRNAKVADDAVSETSDQTKYDLDYETVSKDELGVSDLQCPSVSSHKPKSSPPPTNDHHPFEPLMAQSDAIAKTLERALAATNANRDRIQRDLSTVSRPPVRPSCAPFKVAAQACHRHPSIFCLFITNSRTAQQDSDARFEPVEGPRCAARDGPSLQRRMEHLTAPRAGVFRICGFCIRGGSGAGSIGDLAVSANLARDL